MDYLSKEKFMGLKGYLALVVLIHHTNLFSLLVDGTYLSYIFWISGRWAVYLFAFITGYGLYSSYMGKGDGYIIAFPRKRIASYYITNMIFVLIYVIYYIVYSSELTVSLLVKSFTFGGTIISFGWYLQFAMFIYLAFWASFRFFKKPWHRSVSVLITSILYTAFVSVIGEVHYVPILFVGYMAGMIISKYKRRIDDVMKSSAVMILVVSVITFILSSVVYVSYSVGGYVISYMTKEYPVSLIVELSEIFMCISFMYLVNGKCDLIIDNAFSRFLGRESLEIYALQGIVLGVLSYTALFNMKLLYFVVSIIMTIVIAFLFTSIKVWLKRILIRK